MHHDHDGHEPLAGFWGSRHALGLLVIGGIATYFLLEEHWVHVRGLLPYIFLLACPLMHVFMHHGHHKSGPSSSNGPSPGHDAHDDSRQPGERP